MGESKLFGISILVKDAYEAALQFGQKAAFQARIHYRSFALNKLLKVSHSEDFWQSELCSVWWSTCFYPAGGYQTCLILWADSRTPIIFICHVSKHQLGTTEKSPDHVWCLVFSNMFRFEKLCNAFQTLEGRIIMQPTLWNTRCWCTPKTLPT